MTARATTSPRISRETRDCTPMAILAQGARDMTSVGLKAGACGGCRRPFHRCRVRSTAGRRRGRYRPTPLQEIYNAEDRTHAEKAVTVFDKTYGSKWPKAAKKITGEVAELLAFYDFPAEHWIHLRTTNPIESTFSTVKLRTKVTRGASSPAAALAMVFKLVESAQVRWRAVTGAHLVALVRAGARFEDGALVEREQSAAA